MCATSFGHINLWRLRAEARGVVPIDGATVPHSTGGSRSFGAKNNDPLEVLVFTGVFERPFWLGYDVRDKAQQ
jgi:hypothetical protein